VVEHVDDDEDPRDINFPNPKGKIKVNRLELDSSASDYTKPIKMHNVNINSKDNPKFTIIVDY